MLHCVSYKVPLSFSTFISFFLHVVFFLFLSFLSNAWPRPIWCTCQLLPRSYQSLGVFICQRTSPRHCLPEETRAKKVKRLHFKTNTWFLLASKNISSENQAPLSFPHRTTARLSRSLTFSPPTPPLCLSSSDLVFRSQRVFKFAVGIKPILCSSKDTSHKLYKHVP